jgi:hypothetical protein
MEVSGDRGPMNEWTSLNSLVIRNVYLQVLLLDPHMNSNVSRKEFADRCGRGMRWIGYCVYFTTASGRQLEPAGL